MNQKNLTKSVLCFVSYQGCFVLEAAQSLPSSCNSCMHILTSASVRKGLDGESFYERNEYLIVSKELNSVHLHYLKEPYTQMFDIFPSMF